MAVDFQNTIIGNHVILRKVEISDAEYIFVLRSGYSGRFLRHPPGYSVIMQESWIKGRDNSEINYIIQDRKTSANVGMIGIYEINEADQVAEVGRLLLSDDHLAKSNPFGLEALLITYNYVFNVMNFRKITGIVGSINKAMVRLQLLLGMKQEGYLEKHTMINGNFEDLHILSLFKDQFNNYYKKKISFLLKNFN